MNQMSQQVRRSRNRSLRRSVAVPAAVVCVAGFVWGNRARGADLLTLDRPASPVVSGQIVAVSWDTVTLDIQGSQQQFGVADIRRITLEGEPAVLPNIRSLIQAAQYEQALQLVGQIEPGALSRDLVRQEVEFLKARALAGQALAGLGDANQAGRDLLEFVRQYRDSFHFYEVAELLGHLAIHVGSHDQAIRYYAQIRKSPSPQFQMRGALLEAKAAAAAEQYRAAIERYQQVISSVGNDAGTVRQKTMAQLGMARCLAQLNQTDQALAIIQQVIADNDPADRELFAQAYNALGTAYRLANQPVDAVLAYLHTDVLFYSEQDAHAEALYYLSQLWNDLEQPDRSVQARNLLRSRYPGSVWARK